MKQYRSKKAGMNIIRTYDELVKEWGIPAEELYVETRYGKTHVLAAGNPEGKPVILFHGVGDDSALMWVYNAKKLGEQYMLYAVDTIGGPGKSECGEKYTKEFNDTYWIDDIMKGLKLDKASFIGVSHGGYLVQMYTAFRPEKVDKAIAISCVITTDRKGSPIKKMMQVFLPEALFPTDKNVIKLLKKMSGSNYKVFTENSLILEHFRWLLKGFNNMAMGYHKVEPFTKDQVDIIRNRVNFLVGEEDPFEKLGGKEVMLEYKAKAKFYPDAGHGLNQELADEVNEDLIKLLQK